MSSSFAQKLALDTSKKQKKSPWPICQHFDEEKNHFNYLCKTSEERIQPRPIQKKDLQGFKEVTYELKKNELFHELKQVALDATDAQVNKIKAYLECLNTKKNVKSVKLNQKAGSTSLNCNRLKVQLISEVNDELPKFRVSSALRGRSKYKHLYNSELDFGRSRSTKNLALHKDRLNQTYKSPPLSDEQMSIFLESSELFTIIPKHLIKHKDTPHIALTPKEVQLALSTYKLTGDSSENTLESKEQLWLAKASNDSNSPFHKCVIKTSDNPVRYRFPSYHLEQEKELAQHCGNDYFKEPELSGALALGDITGLEDKIKKGSAFHSFLSDTNPKRLTHAVNPEIHKKWERQYNETLGKTPYLGYLQLTSEDLLDDSDLENENKVKNKIENITNKLHSSFEKLLEAILISRKSIESKKHLRQLTSLEALIPKYLQSKEPLYKSDCDVLAKEHRIEKRNEAIVDGSLIALSIVGGISCPFTFGIGCAVTVGSELTNIARTQNQVYLNKNLFLTGHATIEQYLESKKKAQQTIALAPLSIVGLPAISSTAKGARLLSQIGKGSQKLLNRSKAQLQKVTSAARLKNVVDEFPVKETRSQSFASAEAIEHIRVIDSIDDQIRFLMREMPEADPDQLRFLLQQARDKNIRVVFGGSRIRGAGQYKPTSDLDVGFHSTERGTRNLEKVVQKVVKEANKKTVFPNGLQIEDGVKIYTKNQTPTISAIESPEEFFMRSGVRQAPDPKAGQAYNPSGYLSISPKGEVIRGVPVTP